MTNSPSAAPTTRHHRIDYVELAGAGDLPAVQAFYETAFGWSFTPYGPAYAGIASPDGEGEVGGIDGAAPASAGGVLVLLYSDDLAATLTAVEDAGGAIVVPPYDFPGGRRFCFTDPAGNRLGVWTAAGE